MRFKLTLLFASVLASMAVFAADELRLTQGVSYSKNGLAFQISQQSASWTITGNGSLQNVQLITTATNGDLLVMGGITNQGFGSFKNLGPLVTYTNGTQTNLIQIGSLDSGGLFLPAQQLNVYQVTTGWFATNGLRARVIGTNSVPLSYTILDR